ncbi:MAG: lysophospholipid acyltransferase family protein [Terrimicrobiaceae bacterium]
MATLRVSSGVDEAGKCLDRPRVFRPLAYPGQIVATILFFLIGIVVSPACWVLHRIAGPRIPARLGQNLLKKLFRFFTWWMRITGMLRIKVCGLEALSGLRGTVIVSNHPALLDAVFLLAHLPPTACVMRANLLRNPVLCGSALLADYVTNDSGPALVRQGIKKILAGGNLLVFPEGSRTIDPPLNPFKNGFALVAARTSAAVQTIVIEYRGSHLTKGISLFLPATLPLCFEIRAGELFRLGPEETADDFSHRIESWFRGELAAPPAHT